MNNPIHITIDYGQGYFRTFTLNTELSEMICNGETLIIETVHPNTGNEILIAKPKNE